MNCQKCGAHNSPRNKICNECGAQIIPGMYEKILDGCKRAAEELKRQWLAANR